MGTRKQSWVAVTGMVVAVALGSPAHARGPGGGWHGGKGGQGHGFMRAELIAQVATELGVEETTLTRIRELTYEANKELVDLQADAHRSRVDLRHQLDSDAPDASEVMRLVEELGAKETRVHKNRVGLLLSIRALLTPEQRHKLRGVLAKRWVEHGRRWGAPGQGRGDPGPDGLGAPGPGGCRGPGGCGF